MFKFFRKYNKIILVAGGVLLMVAFLVQGTVGMFMASPADQPVGTIEGAELTVGDRQTAAAEMQMLEAIHPVLGQLALSLVGEPDPEKWMLMVHDARRLGLDAGDAEVDGLLMGLGVDDRRLLDLSRRSGVSPELIRQAVRHWLMLTRYNDLVLGRSHVPPMQQLQLTLDYLNLQTQAQQTRNPQLYQQAYESLIQSQGTPRLSAPLIQRFIYEQMAEVAGAAAVIDNELYLDRIEPPTESELRELFEAHRDDLPGEGEPWGFGYKAPARVKLEYMAIPVGAVREQVQVEEAEAWARFQANPEAFRPTEPAATQPATQPGEQDLTQRYLQVRDQVIAELREEKAAELAERMVRYAQAALMEDIRRLPEEGGYRVLPEGYEPTPLSVVADRLEQEFGVRAEVHRLTDEWTAVDDLMQVPDLGWTTMVGRTDVRFPQYVRSVRELEPAADNALVSLRLQEGLPSLPMASPDGSRYLFRITEAEPTRAPESLDEVREQVVEDARQLKAYQLLLTEQDQWIDRAASEGLEALAQGEPNVSVVDVPPTPQRARHPLFGTLMVPTVPGVGQSEAFIEAMFNTAEQASEFGATEVSQVPVERRLGAVGIDDRLSLAVYRVDEYDPVARSVYEAQVTQPGVEHAVAQLMLEPNDEELATPSQEALARRLNYRPAVTDEPAAENGAAGEAQASEVASPERG